MPDGLYERDILAWSERQSELLRRLAMGERVNDALDWANLLDEVESVGRSELRTCESLLEQALLHLIKLTAKPEAQAVPHWRGEVVGFLAGARRSFAPSMRQRIDLGALYASALYQAEAEYQREQWASAPRAVCPFELQDLLVERPSVDVLLQMLRAV